jgi:hypothetical protein
MFIRLSLCFHPRSAPRDQFVQDRVHAVFRCSINNERQPAGREVQPWGGIEVNPPWPQRPLTFSSEIKDLEMEPTIPAHMKPYVPKRWESGATEANFCKISWAASAAQRIEQLPSNGSIEQKAAYTAFKEVLSKGISGKLVVLIRNGRNIANRINQLASTLVPAPHLFWPWMNGHFFFTEKGLSKPLEYHPAKFEKNAHWVYNAFVERNETDLQSNGLKASVNPAAPLERFFHGYPVTKFVDVRQYYASQALSALYEARAELENQQTWVDGHHRFFAIPDANGRRYMILLNVRKPVTSDDGLAENTGAMLPEVGEPVRIKTEIEKTEEEWRGRVVPMPNAYAARGCNVAIDASSGEGGRRVVGPQLELSGDFEFGYANIRLAPALDRLAHLCFGSNQDLKWFRDMLLCQWAAPSIRGDVGLPPNWMAEVNNVVARRQLNAEQKLAVVRFFQNRVSMLIGPPGTGKSTVVDTILELECRFHSRFWVMAESNKAVDVLVDKFCERLGADQIPPYYRIRRLFQETLWENRESTGWTPSGFDDQVLSREAVAAIQRFFDENGQSKGKLALGADLAARFDMLTDNGFEAGVKPRWDGEAEQLKKLRDARLRLKNTSVDGDAAAARHKFMELLSRIQIKTIGEASGLFSTAAAASTRLVGGFQPASIIIDEASQAKEFDVVTCITGLLQKSKVARILFVGDHHQLPPVVLAKFNPFANQAKLSLFERLRMAKFNATMLVTQYRMHPEISDLANMVIYEKQLRDGANTTNQNGYVERFRKFTRTIGLDTATNSVVVSLKQMKGWHFGSQQKLTSTSRFNPHAAWVVVQLVCRLVEFGFKPRDVMILAFYKDQVQLYQSTFGNFSKDVRVCTVDSSQGSQARIVIVDSVLLGGGANETCGFLGGEKRRCNVAMTRAEAGRIVVGHVDFGKGKHLQAGNPWARFYADEQRRRHVIHSDRIPDQRIPHNLQTAFDGAKAGFEGAATRMPRHDNLGPYSMSVPPAQMELIITRFQKRATPSVAEFFEMTGIGIRLAERYMQMARGDASEAFRQFCGEHFVMGRVQEIDADEDDEAVGHLPNQLMRLQVKHA